MKEQTMTIEELLAIAARWLATIDNCESLEDAAYCAQVVQAAAQTAQASRHWSEVERLNGDLAAAIAERDAARAEASLWLSESERLEVELLTVEAERDAARTELHETRMHVDILESELVRRVETMDNLCAERDALREQIAKLRELVEQHAKEQHMGSVWLEAQVKAICK